jgi:hypothetical protein
VPAHDLGAHEKLTSGKWRTRCPSPKVLPLADSSGDISVSLETLGASHEQSF